MENPFRIRFTVVVIFLVFFYGCNNEQGESSPYTAAPPQSPNTIETKHKNIIPKNLVYVTTNTDLKHSVKRGLEILLNKEVSSEVLAAIALEVKAREKLSQSTVIEFNISGYDKNNGPWATVSFNPDIEVRILNLAKQKAGNTDQEDIKTDKIIGAWRNETPFMGGIVIIYTKASKQYVVFKFADESVVEKEITGSKTVAGERFDYLNTENSYGEFFRINAFHELECYDKEGLISVMKQIQ